MGSTGLALRCFDDDFWAKLGGQGDIQAADAVTDRIPDPEIGEGVLYRISDTTALTTEEVARGELTKSMLESDNVMMLDTQVEIFIWIGKGASRVEDRNAFRTATRFLQVNNRPGTTPVHCFREGQTIQSAEWQKIFAN